MDCACIMVDITNRTTWGISFTVYFQVISKAKTPKTEFAKAVDPSAQGKNIKEAADIVEVG